MSFARLFSFVAVVLLITTLFAELATVQATSDAAVSKVSIIETVAGDATLSRLPHQRKSFYAEGLWWLFYGVYPDASHPGPLCYITSSDGGATWSSPTSLGHNVGYDAVWTVAYDSTNNKLWVGLSDATLSSNGNYGFIVRRGSPQSKGIISWDQPWQTAIASSVMVSDPNMVIDTHQDLWIGYNDWVRKNANTDGTWATASGFPAYLYGNQILAPLSDGGIYSEL